MPRALNATAAMYGLTGLTALEVLAQTYGFLLGYPAISSVLYLLSGLGVALLPAWRWEGPAAHNGSNGHHQFLLLILLTVTVGYILWRTPALIDAVPLDYRQADMLPVIQVMAERRLAGEAVYATIDTIWDGMRPIYLPAMWLPYLIGTFLDADIRWVSAAALIGSLCIIATATRQSNAVSFGFLRPVIFLPILLLVAYVFHFYSTFFTLSEEPIVVFYYVLLAWGLIRPWPVMTGAAMALCLLSRYALAFWVPMFILFQYRFQSRRSAGITGAALIITLLLLFTLGQAWDQIPFFLQLQDAYLGELLDEAGNWGLKAQITGNPGLVKFLPFSAIALWHRLLIYGSALLPFIILSFYYYRHRQLDTRFFGLCSLKLCMVYFYNMLTVPYSYLFYPSTFLSLFILAAVLACKKTQPEGNYSIRQAVA